MGKSDRVKKNQAVTSECLRPPTGEMTNGVVDLPGKEGTVDFDSGQWYVPLAIENERSRAVGCGQALANRISKRM
jgi:hypothetical protein